MVQETTIVRCILSRRTSQYDFTSCNVIHYCEQHKLFENRKRFFMDFGPIKSKMIFGNDYNDVNVIGRKNYTKVQNEYHLQLEDNTYVSTSAGLNYIKLDCLPISESLYNIPFEIEFI